MSASAVSADLTGAIEPEVLDEFLAGVRGPVFRANDEEYDQARRIRNGLIDKYPSLIVRCSGAADVIESVNFARDHQLLLSIRGGGHNVAGHAVNDGGLVIDLSAMNGIHVNPDTHTALVQGGATWGDLDRETQVFGLATPGGVVSSTGVAGLTLHGGMGHLRSKHGLSLDNLRSVQIVTADGQLRTASPDENADLFWAVRGAGANFGVVTAFEFQLHPVGPTVMLCAPLYALSDGPQVLRGWRDFCARAPDEFTPLAIFWSVPEGFPEDVVGIPVIILAGVYAGQIEDGERFIQPLRELATPVLDMSQPMPFTLIQNAFDAYFPTGMHYYWKSTYVDQLSDELLDLLCDLAAKRPSPRTTMDIWPQLGAARRSGGQDMAFGQRRPFMIAFESSWFDAAENDANIAWARDAYDAMKHFDSSGAYLNFPGFGEEKTDLLRAAYGEANYERLVELKTLYDPGNLFRMNQNIPPRT